MDEGYIVAAVKVPKAIRFYTTRPSQQATREQELVREKLTVLLWAEGETEEAALELAMKQAALWQLAERAK